MVFADDVVRALPAVGRQVAVGEMIAGQVAVGEMIAGQALVADDPGVFKICEREARKPAHVDVVGSQNRWQR